MTAGRITRINPWSIGPSSPTDRRVLVKAEWDVAQGWLIKEENNGRL